MARSPESALIVERNSLYAYICAVGVLGGVAQVAVGDGGAGSRRADLYTVER